MIKEEEEGSWRLVGDDHQGHGSVELVKFLKAKLESAHQALWPPDRGSWRRSHLCLRVVEMCHLQYKAEFQLRQHFPEDVSLRKVLGPMYVGKLRLFPPRDSEHMAQMKSLRHVTWLFQNTLGPQTLFNMWHIPRSHRTRGEARGRFLIQWSLLTAVPEDTVEWGSQGARGDAG